MAELLFFLYLEISLMKQPEWKSAASTGELWRTFLVRWYFYCGTTGNDGA